MKTYKEFLGEKNYYTLVGKALNSDKFVIIFGDYDKNVVKDELVDNRGSFRGMKIITTGEKQKDIQAEVDILNVTEEP